MKKAITIGALATIVSLAGGFAFIYESPIYPLDSETVTYDPSLVQRGVELAILGDCKTCHTSASGKAFAGGLARATPFGTVYSTNITPDRGTGIGLWSEAAFRRAMR
jgi:hypothetical protein